MPEAERKFDAWKRKARLHGSSPSSVNSSTVTDLIFCQFYAFHGSPLANWHSILRTGLKSGHVPGVYMADAVSCMTKDQHLILYLGYLLKKLHGIWSASKP